MTRRRSGIGRERGRQRRQLMARVVLWLVVAAIFGAIGYASYQTGSLLARQEVTTQTATIERLQTQIQTQHADADRLRLELSQMREAADGLKRRYDANVPSGGLAALVTLTKERLAAGVKEGRIAQALRDADATRPCEERSLRKRFAIADGAVSFLDGLIQVTTSVPAGTEDLAKGATVSIARVWAAQPIKATGLPVHQTIAINNAELKLSVEPSELRGYGVATLTVCGRL